AVFPPRSLLPRACVPKGPHRDVYQPRVARGKRDSVESERIQFARPKILDQNVGLIEQSPQDLPAGRLFEIEQDAALAPRDIQPCLDVSWGAVWRIHLHHVGTKLSERATACGTRYHHAQIEHPDASQG